MAGGGNAQTYRGDPYPQQKQSMLTQSSFGGGGGATTKVVNTVRNAH